MRILVVSDSIPFPPIGGGQLRTFHLLRALAERHDVTLVGFTTEDGTERPPFPTRVVPVPWDWPPLYSEMMFGDASSSQSAYEKLEYDCDVPWCANWAQTELMAKTVRAVAQDSFDLALIEHSYMAGSLQDLPARIPRVLDLVDVHALMTQCAVEGTIGDERVHAVREAAKTLRFERSAASQCIRCLVVSENEAAAARTLLGIDCVEVVANGVDTSFFTPSQDEPTRGFLLYTGTMNYPPNIEAVEWFVSDVLPRIHERVPGAELHVAGARPTERVTSLASKHVIVHGQVSDMRPYYRQASVVVVPLLGGGGTRLKILEAAACGKPIVSTSHGAEGLDFVRGKDVLIADSASDFASGVVRLVDERKLRKRMGERARRISLTYDWEPIGARFRGIVESLS